METPQYPCIRYGVVDPETAAFTSNLHVTRPCRMANWRTAFLTPGGKSAAPALPAIQQSVEHEPSLIVVPSSTSKPHTDCVCRCASCGERKRSGGGRHAAHPAISVGGTGIRSCSVSSLPSSPPPSAWTALALRRTAPSADAAIALPAPIKPASHPQVKHAHFAASKVTRVTRARVTYARRSIAAPTPAIAAAESWERVAARGASFCGVLSPSANALVRWSPTKLSAVRWSPSKLTVPVAGDFKNNLAFRLSFKYTLALALTCRVAPLTTTTAPWPHPVGMCEGSTSPQYASIVSSGFAISPNVSLSFRSPPRSSRILSSRTISAVKSFRTRSGCGGHRFRWDGSARHSRVSETEPHTPLGVGVSTYLTLSPYLLKFPCTADPPGLSMMTISRRATRTCARQKLFSRLEAASSADVALAATLSTNKRHFFKTTRDPCGIISSTETFSISRCI
mmetsp:Transcript_670/g.2572  ORF Transcript_670/g.2572 Transcript_670/m.2572 type:complete len:452 (+) Transcript_670:334-1689(+)